MPETVAAVAVVPGAKVAQGDALLTIEAMKMETVVRAERAGTVSGILVQAGDSIDAKDLLAIML